MAKKDAGDLKARVRKAIGDRKLVIRFCDPASTTLEEVAEDIERAVKIHDEAHPASSKE